MKTSTFREHVGDISDVGDDPASFLIGFGVWLAVIVAAPVLTVLLAGLLLPVELGVLVVAALVLLVVRLAGVVRWTVVIQQANGAETVETYRLLTRAVRRVRSVNGTLRRSVHLVI